MSQKNDFFLHGLVENLIWIKEPGKKSFGKVWGVRILKMGKFVYQNGMFFKLPDTFFFLSWNRSINIEYDEIIQTLSERVKFLVLETRDLS